MPVEIAAVAISVTLLVNAGIELGYRWSPHRSKDRRSAICLISNRSSQVATLLHTYTLGACIRMHRNSRNQISAGCRQLRSGVSSAWDTVQDVASSCRTLVCRSCITAVKPGMVRGGAYLRQAIMSCYIHPYCSPVPKLSWSTVARKASASLQAALATTATSVVQPQLGSVVTAPCSGRCQGGNIGLEVWHELSANVFRVRPHSSPALAQAVGI